MSTKEPWLERWKIVSDLSGGGQGTTFVVQSAAGPGLGVLKILRYQESDEARRRMFREVNNLRVLHNAGCRIPQVLGGNTEQFEDTRVPLFFVMEFIEGETLATHVSKTKGLPLTEAAALLLKLCETIRIGQKETILHRDLKPENIVIRSVPAGSPGVLEHNIVIVDYGLSFNRNEDELLTHGSETLDNKFLSLPERRVPGGDRRDPRSDVTGLCGILYYCITGELPVDLVDANGNAPHMRRGRSIREKLGDNGTTRQLEALFGRGFSVNIEYRFQSVEEFVSRLKEVMDPSARVPNQDLTVVAKRGAESLMARDRKTQLAAYKQNAEMVVDELGRLIAEIEDEIEPFALRMGNAMSAHGGNIEGYENMDANRIILISDHNNSNWVQVEYRVLVCGSQCAVWRCLFKGGGSGGAGNVTKIGEWECVMRFEGMEKPGTGAVMQDCEAIVADAVQILVGDILEAGEGKK